MLVNDEEVALAAMDQFHDDKSEVELPDDLHLTEIVLGDLLVEFLDGLVVICFQVGEKPLLLGRSGGILQKKVRRGVSDLHKTHKNPFGSRIYLAVVVCSRLFLVPGHVKT